MTAMSVTDSGEVNGATVALIDAIIAIAYSTRELDLGDKEIKEALKELNQNKDLQRLLAG